MLTEMPKGSRERSSKRVSPSKATCGHKGFAEASSEAFMSGDQDAPLMTDGGLQHSEALPTFSVRMLMSGYSASCRHTDSCVCLLERRPTDQSQTPYQDIEQLRCNNASPPLTSSSLRTFSCTMRSMLSKRSMSAARRIWMPLVLSRSGSTHRESHRMMQHLNLQQHSHLSACGAKGSPVAVTQHLALQPTRKDRCKPPGCLCRAGGRLGHVQGLRSDDTPLWRTQ